MPVKKVVEQNDLLEKMTQELCDMADKQGLIDRKVPSIIWQIKRLTVGHLTTEKDLLAHRPDIYTDLLTSLPQKPTSVPGKMAFWSFRHKDEWVKFPGKIKKGGVIIPDDNITL